MICRGHDLHDVVRAVSEDLNLDLSSLLDDLQELITCYTASIHPRTTNAVPSELHVEVKPQDRVEKAEVALHG